MDSLKFSQGLLKTISCPTQNSATLQTFMGMEWVHYWLFEVWVFKFKGKTHNKFFIQNVQSINPRRLLPLPINCQDSLISIKFTVKLHYVQFIGNTLRLFLVLPTYSSGFTLAHYWPTTGKDYIFWLLWNIRRGKSRLFLWLA